MKNQPIFLFLFAIVISHIIVVLLFYYRGVSSCCQTNTYIRPNKKEDNKAFKSLYEDHDLSLFYAIFHNDTPQYILEAGAGAGFTSQLFKLIWPRAVLVTLESDAANFETMVMNTREYVSK
jgi:predicted O-methyltransferase YrrM